MIDEAERRNAIKRIRRWLARKIDPTEDGGEMRVVVNAASDEDFEEQVVKALRNYQKKNGTRLS